MKVGPDSGSLQTLVIGYGNDLRGDDAAGSLIADRVAEWNLPGVSVRHCQQLTPELAEPVSRVDRVIFVDATPAAACPEVTAVRLPGDAPSPPPVLAHACTPEAILELARTLYGGRAAAWLVMVPAAQWETGAPLSAPCAAAAQRAIEWIRRLLTEPEAGAALEA